MISQFANKFKDSIISILPITFLVVILSVFVVPEILPLLPNFLICCALIVVGIAFFTMGADTAMFPVGQHVGGYLSKRKSPWPLLLCSLVLGIIITIAEPDLTVLAGQVSWVNNWVFILSVSVGVGLFLVLAVLRVIFKWKLNVVLLVCYALVFLLVIFVDQGIIPVSFDSGSVTTGPISVPFIMAFAAGIAAVRGTGSKDDGFGFIGFASAGPILVVMLLFCFIGGGHLGQEASGALSYGPAFLEQLWKVAIILLPIVLFFGVFQGFALKLPPKEILKIGTGIVFTYVGIVLFLVGVNVGFLPVGSKIGHLLAQNHQNLLIPICAIIGFCMAMVEPAVQVLAKQIESITGGTIKRHVMMLCVAIGVAVALLLCAVRLLTHISILWILVPSYVLIFVLSFFVPKLFVGIAFDSGGVATGAIATTFAMPLVLGACNALGGNPMIEAFGTLAFCAAAPILVVLFFGVIYKIAQKQTATKTAQKLKRVDIVEYD